jgi:hypothetical protein
MNSLKFTTGTGTPALTLVNGGVPTSFRGFTASNAEGATIYLKLWWVGPNPLQSIPTIGTTAPSATLAIPSAGQPVADLNLPLQGGGPLYYAVTKNAGDTDDTALTTGGDVVTLFLN